MRRWTDLIDLVVLMTCDPATSIEREYSSQLTTKRGTIMSEEPLRQINASIEATKQTYGARFKAIEHIDTRGNVQSRQTAALVASKALAALTNFIDEEICGVPAALVSGDIPMSGIVKDRSTIDAFVDLVNREKRFVRRSEAEEDPGLVQPIPCALIRWNEKVLLLKKNKKGHALHDKYLLWAGGHVNTSDNSQDVLVSALERELSEEIFIKGNYQIADKPVALLRTDETARASRHIGVLYEITLTSADVASTMDREFKETRGMSMSARLVTPSEIKGVYGSLNDWSKSIVELFWPGLEVSKAPLLSDQ